MKVVSMRGVALNMARYIAHNEDAVAIGNAGMNARGDLIGNGGQIVKRREQLAMEYHARNPKAVRQVALNDIASEILTPAEAVKSIRTMKAGTTVVTGKPVATSETIPAPAAPKGAKPGRKIEDAE